jgi:hypothetical protein
VDFLLECIGFTPNMDLEHIQEQVRQLGEPVAWRGPSGEHLKLKLAEGIELRLDHDEGQSYTSLLPFFEERSRLRVAVNEARKVPDSPFDALLTGWVAPPRAGGFEPWGAPGAYLLSAWLTDARRLPRGLKAGHVLAISIAGFSLDVRYVGPNSEGSQTNFEELPNGAFIESLGGGDSPGGCCDLSARILSIRHTRNKITGEPIEIIEVDAPERPLHLFVSPWQLKMDQLPMPRPGFRIEGTFMFTGRIAGGLPKSGKVTRRNFG